MTSKFSKMAIAMLFAITFLFSAAQAQTVTAEQRVLLGYATRLTVPSGSQFIAAGPEQYGEQLGVKVVYDYAADQTQYETRYVVADLCSVLNGPVSGYRKARISRFDITGAYWDITGRVEPGTYTVCVYELIPKG